MDQSPSPPLVSRVSRIVFDTFLVSEVEARECAEGLVALAEGWGGPNVADLDWHHEVKKRFGEELKWKSEIGRQQYFAERHRTFSAYENYIRQRK